MPHTSCEDRSDPPVEPIARPYPQHTIEGITSPPLSPSPTLPLPWPSSCTSPNVSVDYLQTDDEDIDIFSDSDSEEEEEELIVREIPFWFGHEDASHAATVVEAYERFLLDPYVYPSDPPIQPLCRAFQTHFFTEGWIDLTHHPSGHMAGADTNRYSSEGSRAHRQPIRDSAHSTRYPFKLFGCFPQKSSSFASELVPISGQLNPTSPTSPTSPSHPIHPATPLPCLQVEIYQAKASVIGSPMTLVSTRRLLTHWDSDGLPTSFVDLTNDNITFAYWHDREDVLADSSFFNRLLVWTKTSEYKVFVDSYPRLIGYANEPFNYASCV